MICIISWFIVGFIGGILCSGVDFFVNRQPDFNIKMPILLSFFGAFLIVWFFMYNQKSKKIRENSYFGDDLFPLH
jgi:hypothetical protein